MEFKFLLCCLLFFSGTFIWAYLIQRLKLLGTVLLFNVSSSRLKNKYYFSWYEIINFMFFREI